MDFEGFKAWLTKATDKRVKYHRGMGFLGMALCPLALAVAAGGICLWLFLLTARRNGGEFEPFCLWIALGAVPFMFLGNRFAPRRSLADQWADEGMSTFRRGQQARMQIFLSIMFAGPRLFDWARDSFRVAGELKRQDTHSCAAVLWVLMGTYKKVPLEDIVKAVPWLNLEAVFPDLQRIPGVQFLRSAPEGLGLTDELRNAIRTGGPIEE